MKTKKNLTVTLVLAASTWVSCSMENSSSLQQTSQDSGKEELALNPIQGVEAVYGGNSEFFNGAEQYRISFCADSTCKQSLKFKSLSLENKLAVADMVLEKTDKKMRAYFYSLGWFDEVNSLSTRIDVETAVQLAKTKGSDGSSTFGLSPEEAKKMENYLNKNKDDLVLFKTSFGMSGLGDGASRTITIYNAKTAWVTYVVIFSYSE